MKELKAKIIKIVNDYIDNQETSESIAEEIMEEIKKREPKTMD
jgi:hypothetical protein